ncbi:MAG: CaiB/BaiF CoA transferase family protein [Roseobacter sp.]
MGALDGILVIAIEQAVAAPMCTVRLADAGARVIKIERPEGETARHYDYAVEGSCTYFTWLNRGKESAVLDLKTDTDMALMRRMLGQADVLVQNLAPGAMDRLGLGNAMLQRDYPQLIVVSICGYGADTDYAGMKAYDLLVQAESGICAITGTEQEPCKVGAPVADVATGTNAHAAVLEALIARGRTGTGQCIEVAMFDGLADWLAVPFLHQEHAHTTTQRHGMSHATVYPYRPYQCEDGTLLLAVQNNQQWARFCTKALERPDLTARTDFATNADRVRHRTALDAELVPWFASQMVADAIAKLETAGIAWARYRDVSGLAEHPALRRTRVTLENGAEVEIPRPAGRDDTFRPGPLPALGADTKKIRAEFGSMS